MAGKDSVGDPVAPVGQDLGPFDIAKLFLEGTTSARVTSAAGSGKTATITAVLNQVTSEPELTLGLAYNKSAVVEVAQQVTSAVRVSTFHGFGAQGCRDFFAQSLPGVPLGQILDSQWEEKLSGRSPILLAEDPADPIESSGERNLTNPPRTGWMDIDQLKTQKTLAFIAAEEAKLPSPPTIVIGKDLDIKQLVKMVGYAKNSALIPPLDPRGIIPADREIDLRDSVEPIDFAPYQGGDLPFKPPTDLESLVRIYRNEFRFEEHQWARVKQVVECALRLGIRDAIFGSSGNVHTLDLDDLVYIPTIAKNISVPKFQTIAVDEAQDLSVLRITLVTRNLLPGGRLLAVGDDKQSIYAYTGSLPNSLAYLPAIFPDMVDLSLPVTQRCPVSHVALAHAYDRATSSKTDMNLKAKPNAQFGELEYLAETLDFISGCDLRRYASLFSSGTLVLARYKAVLEALSWELIVSGIPQYLAVDEVKNPAGQALIDAVNQLLACWKNAYPKDHRLDMLPKRLHQKTSVANVLLKDLKRAHRLSATLSKDHDRLLKATVERVLKDKGEGIATIFDLQNEILRLCPRLDTRRTPNDNAGEFVFLSTVHSAKGLGRERVVLLNPGDLNPDRRDDRWERKEDWEKDQEHNLGHVALTRAIINLTLVDVRFVELSGHEAPYKKTEKTPARSVFFDQTIKEIHRARNEIMRNHSAVATGSIAFAPAAESVLQPAGAVVPPLSPRAAPILPIAPAKSPGPGPGPPASHALPISPAKSPTKAAPTRPRKPAVPTSANHRQRKRLDFELVQEATPVSEPKAKKPRFESHPRSPTKKPWQKVQGALTDEQARNVLDHIEDSDDETFGPGPPKPKFNLRLPEPVEGTPQFDDDNDFDKALTEFKSPTRRR